MDLFTERYNKLNPAQKEAVDAIEGPVMVIAGPGTGKTEILTLRIANILQKTDTPPEAILALTFTEAAAANMRRRLVKLIGSKGYYVQIATFHGFANRVIQENPDKFPHIAGSKSATQVDQIAIIRRILDSKYWELLSPFGDKYLYVSDILNAIRDSKREGLDPKSLAKKVKLRKTEIMESPDLHHEKGPHKGKIKGEYAKAIEALEKAEEFSKIYEAYEEALLDGRLYDFDDMILEAIEALEEDKNLLLQIQESCQYVLVDEHQDTNGAQNKLLELLMNYFDNPNIFAVGDEKQAIFRFQGASLQNFYYFKERYPGVKLVTLKENYRSTQTILDSAHSVILQNAQVNQTELRSNRPAALSKINIRYFSTPFAEALFVANLAKQKIEEGVLPEEIAVLYRDNRDVAVFAEMLERVGLPFVIESDQDLLRDPEIKKLILLLSAISEYGRDEKLAEALHIDFLDIDPLDLYRLVELREHRNASISHLIKNGDKMTALGVEGVEKLLALSEKFARWKKLSANNPFLFFFEKIIEESGYLSHILKKSGYLADVARLSTLFDEARKMVGNNGEYKLKDFLAHIEIFKDHNVMIKAKYVKTPKAIRLMTAHKAKGQEFDVVLITGLSDKHWGNRRNVSRLKLPLDDALVLSSEEKNEDERRLFYVALTRARSECYVTYPTHKEDGAELVPSQFIGEIKEELCDVRGGEAEEKQIEEDPTILFASRKNKEVAKEDKDFLRDLFEKRGLNATALNNYLKCPWRYFYSNLIRIPKNQTKHQIYGTAVHAALQIYFEAKKMGESVDQEIMIRKYEEVVSRAPLKEMDRQELVLRGKETLSAYYENYKNIWNYNTINEFSISGVDLEEKVKLSGKLDKLELLDGPDEIVVIDYKTKQPMSRNAIEGGTRDSNGDYKRQLIFYKLLLDLYPSRKFILRGAGIDFVEPNERGAFKREMFEISEAEVSDLKEVIFRVTEEIKELSFWNEKCGDPKCEYCTLREMMGRESDQLQA